MTASRPRAHLIANRKSGHGRGAKLADEAKTICDELGWELVTYDINSSVDFESQSRKAVDAAEKDQGVVIAAGGDGTIRGVAQAAHNRNVKFAAVPCGTFNFFARTHRIPEDHLEAFRLALTGQARPVRLGKVNAHIFLINASVGLYAKAIHEREMSTSRFGRHRLLVILSSIWSMFNGHQLLRVEMDHDGKKEALQTPMIFIGNNALQLRNLKMSVGHCMKLNLLGVVMLKPISKLEMFRVLVRGIMKTLDNEEKMQTFCTREMTIDTRKSWHTIALDGEMLQTSSPLKVESLPAALNLVLPLEPKEIGK
jgi:diacylglycerol kinase family enzyme